MIFRNSEHYYDLTAGKAIENVMRETRGLSDRPLEPLRDDSLQTGPMQENWEDLAIAIIAAQAEDYRAYRKQLRENPRMGDEKRLLTKVDGEMILKRLKKEEDENDGKGIPAAGLSA